MCRSDTTAAASLSFTQTSASSFPLVLGLSTDGSEGSSVPAKAGSIFGHLPVVTEAGGGQHGRQQCPCTAEHQGSLGEQGALGSLVTHAPCQDPEGLRPADDHRSVKVEMVVRKIRKGAARW